MNSPLPSDHDDGPKPDPLLVATAAEAVLRAGKIQKARFGQDVRIDKKGPIDLVTQVDIEVETMFREMISERYPDHAVLAEELDRDTQATNIPEYCWVFDPIDGTVNYAHGLPIFCASLALEIDGVAEVAAVYDPMREELFMAERGQGARLNGIPLQVSGAETVLDSMLCTGFPYDVHQTVNEIVGLFSNFVSSARAVRRLGSAALDLCYVAAGRFDGFWEQRLQPWDMAAGALLVEEAGGRVTDMEGYPFSSRTGSIIASNGRVHEEMERIILSRHSTRTGR